MSILNSFKAICVYIGIAIAVIFGIYNAGKKSEKANQNERVLKNVKKAKKIDKSNAGLTSDEIRKRMLDNYSRSE